MNATTTRICVVKGALEESRRRPELDLKCLCVRHADGSTAYSNDVRLEGPARVVFDHEGLPDGTHAWVETDGPVTTT